MSGDNYYFGDSVTMNGGIGNTGIVKNQGAADGAGAVSPALLEAVEELRRLVEALREQVPPASAQAIDDSLPALTADATTAPQERHRALMAIAGVAATVGAVGQPVLDLVNRILGLLGG
ncbi:hypothetical protein [Streptomyces aurantiogriseus]|uniref:Uncharacterized protein n=1 Tax=Streptomyces aurantiogriseus TaxID=66870 RepID=A0A918FHW1_9ACTN|nr:hypothetical protein [Streptomyces aurantiogriseus]GGR38651.1 hypothetical protein GCM10010251_64050 [Streptomyces aurantiogriseus]